MSGLERQARPLEVVQPATGELVRLDAPTDELALAIDNAREQAGALQGFVRELSDELLTRMDREATWTAHLPGITVKGDGPRAPDFDPKRLHSELSELERLGIIGERARLEAVERTEGFKVKKRGVNALAKLPDERVAAALARAAIPNEKPRRVTVERG